MGGEGMTKTENASPHTENAPDQGMTTGMTKNTNQQQDTDSDNKLKHAVGKAVAKSDTMGAEVSMIVECYPESISTSCICGMLEERGGSLGIKERYGKWYV
jgi:hypothetical protein